MRCEQPQVVVSALDTPIGIRTNDPELRDRLLHQWSRALTDAPAQAWVDPPVELTGDELDYRITTQVTLAALEANIGTKVLLHAAGLAAPDGRTLVLAAASGAGKTTAARMLGGTLGYLSDESVSVDSTGRVGAHPKPLSVVSGPGKEQHSPDDLGLRHPPEHPRITRLVILDRAETHQQVGLFRLPLLDGLMLLVPHTSGLALLPRPLHALHQLSLRTGGIYRLRYRTIGEHHDELVDFLNDSEPPDGLADEPVDHLPPATRAAAPGEVARAPYVDALAVADRVLVFREATGYLLDQLGATVWRAARPGSLPELVRTAVAEHGPHPEAEALVAAAVTSLAESGLVLTGPAS